MTQLAAAIVLAVALSAASPSLAHHSFAAYDSTRTLALTGTVESFAWANPHAVLRILAPATGGEAQAQWEVETSSPGIMQRFGWKRDSVRRGDRVVVVLNPMRDGSHRGRLHTVTLVDSGKVLITKLSVSLAQAQP